MKAYKIFDTDNYGHPEDIEIVKEGCMLKYLREMIKIQCMPECNIEMWKESHKYLPQSEKEAIDFFEESGYYVEKVTVYE